MRKSKRNMKRKRARWGKQMRKPSSINFSFMKNSRRTYKLYCDKHKKYLCKRISSGMIVYYFSTKGTTFSGHSAIKQITDMKGKSGIALRPIRIK